MENMLCSLSEPMKSKLNVTPALFGQLKITSSKSDCILYAVIDFNFIIYLNDGGFRVLIA